MQTHNRKTHTLVKQFALHGTRPIASRHHSLAWPAVIQALLESSCKHFLLCATGKWYRAVSALVIDFLMPHSQTSVSIPASSTEASVVKNVKGIGPLLLAEKSQSSLSFS